MRGPGKGNTNNPKGKPAGTKNRKTEQWEVLAESIVTTHAKRFNDVLNNLGDEDFAKIYTQILGYFKPKISHNIVENTEKPTIQFINVSEKFKLNSEKDSVN